MTVTAVTIPGTPLLLPGATGQPVPEVAALRTAVRQALRHGCRDQPTTGEHHQQDHPGQFGSKVSGQPQNAGSNTSSQRSATSHTTTQAETTSWPPNQVHIVATDPRLPPSSPAQSWPADAPDSLAGFGFALHSQGPRDPQGVAAPPPASSANNQATWADDHLACMNQPQTLPTGLAVGRAMVGQHLPGVSMSLWAVAGTGPTGPAHALGQQLTKNPLIVVADGSACLGPKPPRGIHPQADAVQRRLVAAVSSGDVTALQTITPAEAEEVHMTGHNAWAVLAGWAQHTTPQARLIHQAQPWGVGYVVALWERQQ